MRFLSTVPSHFRFAPPDILKSHYCFAESKICFSNFTLFKVECVRIVLKIDIKLLKLIKIKCVENDYDIQLNYLHLNIDCSSYISR